MLCKVVNDNCRLNRRAGYTLHMLHVVIHYPCMLYARCMLALSESFAWLQCAQDSITHTSGWQQVVCTGQMLMSALSG